MNNKSDPENISSGLDKQIKPTKTDLEEVEPKIAEIKTMERKDWPEAIVEIARDVNESWRHKQDVDNKTEQRKFTLAMAMFLGALILVFILTWQKIISGEAFAYFLGTATGYLISKLK